MKTSHRLKLATAALGFSYSCATLPPDASVAFMDGDLPVSGWLEDSYVGVRNQTAKLINGGASAGRFTCRPCYYSRVEQDPLAQRLTAHWLWTQCALMIFPFD